MSVIARRVERETKMNERTALQEKVENIERNVTEIRSDVKRLDGALAEHRLETQRAFGEVYKAIGDLRDEMKTLIGALRSEIRDVMDKSHRDRTSRKLSVLALIIAGVTAGAAVFNALPVGVSP